MVTAEKPHHILEEAKAIVVETSESEAEIYSGSRPKMTHRVKHAPHM